jgi:uncharacterized membrane protein (UPF0127 family)
MKFIIENKKIEVKKCNLWLKIRGLMFRRRENARALLFSFPKKTRLAIHSWFVFFPFVVLWLDEDKKVIEKKIVRPFVFCIRPKVKYQYLVEIPLNKKYKNIF